MDTRPVLSALSRAVGTPAFSISQLRFVFIEGDAGVGERERFRRLAGGAQQDLRFIECGSCNEVLRRVSSVKALANEAEAGIRIGGVVDRDFRQNTELAIDGVFVLPVHEVENLFLAPASVTALLQQNGQANLVAADIIRDAADRRAGNWMFQYAMATRNASELPEMPVGAKERAKTITWNEIDVNKNAAIAAILDASAFDTHKRNTLKALLEAGANAYARKRTEGDFWKVCEGKQVLNNVARTAGFADAPAMMQATFALWERNDKETPQELKELREYLGSL